MNKSDLVDFVQEVRLKHKNTNSHQSKIVDDYNKSSTPTTQKRFDSQPISYGAIHSNQLSLVNQLTSENNGSKQKNQTLSQFFNPTFPQTSLMKKVIQQNSPHMAQEFQIQSQPQMEKKSTKEKLQKKSPIRNNTVINKVIPNLTNLQIKISQQSTPRKSPTKKTFKSPREMEQQWQKMKYKNNENFQNLMKQSMNHNYQYQLPKSGAFVMLDKTTMENNRNALVQFLMHEVNNVIQQNNQNKINQFIDQKDVSEQRIDGSAEKKKIPKIAPHLSINMKQFQGSSHNKNSDQYNLDGLASTYRQTLQNSDLKDNLVSFRKDNNQSQNEKEDSKTRNDNKLISDSRLSKEENTLVSPHTLGLSPKSAKPAIIEANISTISKKKGSKEGERDIDDIQDSRIDESSSTGKHKFKNQEDILDSSKKQNQTRKFHSKVKKVTNKALDSNRKNENSIEIENPHMVSFDFSNYVSVKSAVREDQTEEKKSVIEEGSREEDKTNSPGLISQIRVYQNKSNLMKPNDELTMASMNQDLAENQSKIIDMNDQIFQPINIQEENQTIRSKMLFHMLQTKSNWANKNSKFVPTLQLQNMKDQINYHPVTAQDGKKRMHTKRFTTTAQIQNRKRSRNDTQEDQNYNFGLSGVSTRNQQAHHTARQIQNFYDSLISNERGSNDDQNSNQEKTRAEYEKVAAMLGSSEVSQYMANSYLIGSTISNMNSQRSKINGAKVILQQFYDEHGMRPKTNEWPTKSTPRDSNGERLQPHWQETLDKFYQEKHGFSCIQNRHQYQIKPTRNPFSVQSHRVTNKSTIQNANNIFTNATIMDAKKRQSTQGKRRSLQPYHKSEINDENSIDSSLLTPISDIKQILEIKKRQNTQNYSNYQESLSNIVSQIQNKAMGRRDLKAAEVNLSHFRPYSVIQNVDLGIKVDENLPKMNKEAQFQFNVVGSVSRESIEQINMIQSRGQSKSLQQRQEKKKLPPHLVQYRGIRNNSRFFQQSYYSTQEDLPLNSVRHLGKEESSEGEKQPVQVNYVGSEENINIPQNTQNEEDISTTTQIISPIQTQQRLEQNSTQRNDQSDIRRQSENSELNTSQQLKAKNIFQIDNPQGSINNDNSQAKQTNKHISTQSEDKQTINRESQYNSISRDKEDNQVKSQSNSQTRPSPINQQKNYFNIISVGNIKKASVNITQSKDQISTHRQEIKISDDQQKKRENVKVKELINQENAKKEGKLHSYIKGNKYKDFITDYTQDGRKFTQSLIKAVLLKDKKLLTYHEENKSLEVLGSQTGNNSQEKINDYGCISSIADADKQQPGNLTCNLKQIAINSFRKQSTHIGATTFQISNRSKSQAGVSDNEEFRRAFKTEKNTLSSDASDKKLEKQIIIGELEVNKQEIIEPESSMQFSMPLKEKESVSMSNGGNQDNQGTKNEIMSMIKKQYFKIEVPNNELKKNYQKRERSMTVPRNALYKGFDRDDRFKKILKMQNEPSKYYLAEDEFIQALNKQFQNSQFDFKSIPSDYERKLKDNFIFKCQSISHIINKLPPKIAEESPQKSIDIGVQNTITKIDDSSMIDGEQTNSIKKKPKIDIVTSVSTLQKSLKHPKDKDYSYSNRKERKNLNSRGNEQENLKVDIESINIRESNSGDTKKRTEQQSAATFKQVATQAAQTPMNLPFEPAKITFPKNNITYRQKNISIISNQHIHSTVSSPDSQKLAMRHQYSFQRDSGFKDREFQTITRLVTSDQRKIETQIDHYAQNADIVQEKRAESNTSDTNTNGNTQREPLITVYLKKSENKKSLINNVMEQSPRSSQLRGGLAKPSTLLTQKPFKQLNKKIAK